MHRTRQQAATGSAGARCAPHRGWGAWWVVALTCLGLAGCGGGGGGGGASDSSADASSNYGVVRVTVKDSFGAAVAGAAVLGPQGTLNTDALGTTLVVIHLPDTTANLTVSRETFANKTVVATSVTGQVRDLTVTLDRATSAAGGSLTSRSGVLPTVANAGQQMTFEIELVVVDGDSRPIGNLSAANFLLRPCTPDAANTRIDCVRSSVAGADAAYTPATSAPAAAQLIAGLPARPYAAALLLDQSGSIVLSDPTGARLFSTKAVLGGLGDGDHALLAAFAGNPGAAIPTSPLTVYGPFRDRASASSYFPTLDALAAQVGGNTPLYASLDSVRQQLAVDATLPVGIPKAVVVFTDGADTNCASPDACRASRDQSIRLANQDQVRIFTIGLSTGVDIAALGELASQTGGAMLYADTADQLLPLNGSVGK